MTRALGFLALVVATSCASGDVSAAWREVETRNVYRNGSEAVPSELAGCTFVGRVSASLPEMSRSVSVSNDPSVLLETLQKMAAGKGANLLLYSLEPGSLQFRDRSLDGKAFHCSSASRTITTPTGLTYTIVQEGSGPAARPGQHVLIHETTTLADGKVQFSTRASGEPLRFLLGGKQVIDGVDQGVAGMRVGETRTLVVPPHLSKRTEYPEGLSPDETLYYEIELVGIEAQ